MSPSHVEDRYKASFSPISHTERIHTDEEALLGLPFISDEKAPHLQTPPHQRDLLSHHFREKKANLANARRSTTYAAEPPFPLLSRHSLSLTGSSGEECKSPSRNSSSSARHLRTVHSSPPALMKPDHTEREEAATRSHSEEGLVPMPVTMPLAGASLCRSQSTDGIDSRLLRSRHVPGAATISAATHLSSATSTERHRSSSVGSGIYEYAPRSLSADISAHLFEDHFSFADSNVEEVGTHIYVLTFLLVDFKFIFSSVSQFFSNQYLLQSYPASPLVGTPLSPTRSSSLSSSSSSSLNGNIGIGMLLSRDPYISPSHNEHATIRNNNLPIAPLKLKSRSAPSARLPINYPPYLLHPKDMANMEDRNGVKAVGGRRQRKRLLFVHNPRLTSNSIMESGWTSEEHLCLFQLIFENGNLKPPKLVTTKHLPGSFLCLKQCEEDGDGCDGHQVR